MSPLAVRLARRVCAASFCSSRNKTPRRLGVLVLLFVTGIGVLADTAAFGAVRINRGNSRSYRSNRTSRSTRTMRPSPLAGVMASMQRAQAALNAVRAEQTAATNNLVRVRSSVNARYENPAALNQAREEFKTAESAHESAKAAVQERLRQNSAEYRAAQAKLSDPEFKASARQLRLDVSALETAALQKDDAAQTAQRQRDTASQRIQTLRRETEAAIAKDSELNGAKTKVAQASTKVNAAQSAYSRAVVSANAAANIARASAAAQATRPRYVGSSRYGRSRGWGHHRPTSRFRRHR